MDGNLRFKVDWASPIVGSKAPGAPGGLIFGGLIFGILRYFATFVT